MPLSGIAVAEIGVGGLILYSGIKGYSIADTFTYLLKGTTPAQTEGISSADYTAGASTLGDVAEGAEIAAGVAGNYSTSQLEQLWESQGGDSDTAAFAAQVALAESGGSPTVTSSNPDGGTNVGLWQLDTNGVGSGHTVAELQNPETNAQITIMATANGTNWEEWSDPVVNAVGGHYTPGEST